MRTHVFRFWRRSAARSSWLFLMPASWAALGCGDAARTSNDRGAESSSVAVEAAASCPITEPTRVITPGPSAAPACTTAAPTLDIAYGSDPKQKLDLYKPSS